MVIIAAEFQLIVGKLYNMGLDEILHRYVLLHEQERILAEALGGIIGGHYKGRTTARKII